MIFHNRQRNIENYKNLVLKLNNLPIKRVRAFNFLGIVINEHMNWNDHISYTSQKINPVVGLLHRLKHQLPSHILKMIYNSLILSRLHYGNLLWGNTPGSIIRLNKRALRAIVNAGYNAHTNPIEKNLKLLSLPDIHQMKLLCLHKKITDNNVPNNISNMFKKLPGNSSVEPRTIAYKSSIRYTLPEYISKAPTEILDKLSNSYACFKWNIKDYILERYSSLCTKIGCRACHLATKID